MLLFIKIKIGFRLQNSKCLYFQRDRLARNISAEPDQQPSAVFGSKAGQGCCFPLVQLSSKGVAGRLILR